MRTPISRLDDATRARVESGQVGLGVDPIASVEVRSLSLVDKQPASVLAQNARVPPLL